MTISADNKCIQSMTFKNMPMSFIGTVTWSENNGPDNKFLDLYFPASQSVKWLTDDFRFLSPIKNRGISSITPAFILIHVCDDLYLGILINGIVKGIWLNSKLMRIYYAHPKATPYPHQISENQLNQNTDQTYITGAIRSRKNQGWILPYRFRHAHRAAFVITDHADFDTPAVYKALMGNEKKIGFADAGIRLSKSVFITKGYGRSNCLSTLDDTYWLSLINTWQQKKQIEFGLHMTRPLPATREEMIQDLTSVLFLKPKFWIDHGVDIPQAIWREGGRKESMYYIWDILLKNGITCYWNYKDLFDDAPGGMLNFLSLANHHIRPDIVRLLSFKGIYEPVAWKSWLNRGLDPSVSSSIRSLFQSFRKNNSIKEQPDFFKSLKMIIYSLKNCNMQQAFFVTDDERYLSSVYSSPNKFSKDCPRFFSSQLIREPVIAWTNKNISCLIKEFGTHIAHTYLGQPKKYSLVFKQGDKYQLSQEFSNIIKTIKKFVISGKLWTPGITDLTESLLLARNVRIVMQENQDIINWEGGGAGISLQIAGNGLPVCEIVPQLICYDNTRILYFPTAYANKAIKFCWPRNTHQTFNLQICKGSE